MTPLNTDGPRPAYPIGVDGPRPAPQPQGRHAHPTRPATLDRIGEADFHRAMLCQNIGDWRHEAVPRGPSIWVAGCGPSQAVSTALCFPTAAVLGSDPSAASLDLSAQAAGDVGVSNLSLRQEDVTHVAYRNQFDYILCAGPLHHADPALPLRRLAEALKPGGLLELMVHNRFHGFMASTFQQAVRILGGTHEDPGGNLEMTLAKLLVAHFPVECLMKDFLTQHPDVSTAGPADVYLSPIEHTFTVQSLCDLAAACDLEILSPGVHTIDRLHGGVVWNLCFESPALQQRYYELDDLQRWQVTNLLLGERSPMLWFYLRRAGAPARRRSEREICEAFLETPFVPTSVARQQFVLGFDGRYRAAAATPYPDAVRDRTLRAVVDEAEEDTPVGELLQRHGYSMSFPDVNEARLRLTTTAFPHLKAAPRN